MSKEQSAHCSSALKLSEHLAPAPLIQLKSHHHHHPRQAQLFFRLGWVPPWLGFGYPLGLWRQGCLFRFSWFPQLPFSFLVLHAFGKSGFLGSFWSRPSLPDPRPLPQPLPRPLPRLLARATTGLVCSHSETSVSVVTAGWVLVFSASDMMIRAAKSWAKKRQNTLWEMQHLRLTSWASNLGECWKMSKVSKTCLVVSWRRECYLLCSKLTDDKHHTEAVSRKHDNHGKSAGHRSLARWELRNVTAAISNFQTRRALNYLTSDWTNSCSAGHPLLKRSQDPKPF